MKHEEMADLINEVEELYIKYGVHDRFTALICIDEKGDAHCPRALSAKGSEEHGVSQQRAAAVLAEQVLAGALDLLMTYNGLDVMAAHGALKGMLDSTAVERSQAMKLAQSRPSFPAEA